MIGHRSAALLRRALASLFRNADPENYELILLVNGSDAAVLPLAEQALMCSPVATLLLRTDEVRPGLARTLAVPYARGEVVLFLDDDVEIYQDVVARAAELFQNPELMAAGGANLTPPGSGALGRASGAVLESFWGTLAMRFRYREVTETKECTEHSLILCNLAVRRSVLTGFGGFPYGMLVSNEENVLLQQLSQAGKKMIVDPGLAVYHRRRDSWSGIAEQSRKYGHGRGQNILVLPESMRPLYFLPSLLLLSCWSFVPLVLYFLIGSLFAVRRFLKHGDWAVLCLQPLIYPVVHFSYGMGFLIALAKWGWRREVLCGAEE